jgi:hypothetical protein
MASASSAAHAESRKRAREEDKGRAGGTFHVHMLTQILVA